MLPEKEKTPAAWGQGFEPQPPPPHPEVVTHCLLLKLDYLPANWVPTPPQRTLFMGPGASDLSFSWRRQPKPQARAEPLWRSSAQLAAAPAQTLSALFTLAQAAGTGGALQRAARGLASRPTWRPKRTPGQRLCGAGGGVHGEESGPVAYLVLTLQPTGHYRQSSAAPQVPYERKSHGPEAQRKKLMLQRF